jgi:hypothetical protein
MPLLYLRWDKKSLNFCRIQQTGHHCATTKSAESRIGIAMNMLRLGFSRSNHAQRKPSFTLQSMCAFAVICMFYRLSCWKYVRTTLWTNGRLLYQALQSNLTPAYSLHSQVIFFQRRSFLYLYQHSFDCSMVNSVAPFVTQHYTLYPGAESIPDAVWVCCGCKRRWLTKELGNVCIGCSHPYAVACCALA